MKAPVLAGGIAAFCALLAAVTLSAQQRPPEAAKAQEAPAEKAVAAPVDPKTYVLGPEDVIYVRVWREPDLSEAAAIRPDGMITMPLIGEVPAAGLTPVQLGARITEKLAQYINRPEVIVSVQAVRSKRYYITGEVYRTGAFPLAVPTTVLEALTLAGGFKEFANTKRIIVLRGAKRYTFNYRDVIKGKNLSQNILLENGDYIIVP